MKLRRLPETDLARIAPLGLDEKWRALRSFNSGGGSWSYDPARAQNFNIANPASPLGLDPCRPPMWKIRELVSQRCKFEKQEQSCLEVVGLFADWYQETAIGAVEFTIPSMAIGSLGVVRYWENFFARIGERNSFFFFDYRRANGLSPVARKFVFSMMHQQIRLSNPDFYDADLVILRFLQSKNVRRISDVHVADDDLYSFAELSQMIDETYFIWLEVLAERKATEPQRSVGGMFG